MSIFFGPLGATALNGVGAMDAELRFDAFGSENAQSGVAAPNIVFGFTGLTARSVSVPERAVEMVGDLNFPIEAAGSYFRTQVAGVDHNVGPSFLALSSGGYMAGSIGFVAEAVGPAPVFDTIGDAALRTIAYGIIGIAQESADEVFSLSQSTRIDLGILVDQPLVLRAPAVHSMQSARALADEVRFGTAIQLTYRLLIAEGLLFADTPAERYVAVTRTLDALLLGGIAATEADAVSTVTAAVLFGLQTDAVALEKLADGLRLGDNFTANLQLAASIVENILLSDSAPSSAVLSLRVEDGVLAGDGVATTAQIAAAVRDALAVGVRFALDDGDYVAWALNTGSKHLSKYEQYPVNSFAVFGARLFGALDDGIYLLEGATDNGDNINARVRFALTDIGTGLQKRVSTAYLGYTATNDLLVKVIHTTEGGGKQAYVYRLNAAPATQPVNGRVTFGKGVKSAYFAFELENVDGGAFNVDAMSIIPMALERRVKRS